MNLACLRGDPSDLVWLKQGEKRVSGNQFRECQGSGYESNGEYCNYN